MNYQESPDLWETGRSTREAARPATRYRQPPTPSRAVPSYRCGCGADPGCNGVCGHSSLCPQEGARGLCLAPNVFDMGCNIGDHGFSGDQRYRGLGSASLRSLQ